MTDYTPAIKKIDSLLKTDKEPILIAIDGRCGSGKSTMGKRLSEKYGCTLLHMDDFYLQDYQRTPERLSEIGGNVDYERFLRDVLTPIKNQEDIRYASFNHQTLRPNKTFLIHPTRLIIIEGSYATHPYFHHPYDLEIFLTITRKQQIDNLRQREGEEKLKDFITRWIPKEEAYFKHYDITKNKLIIHYEP